MNRPLAIAEWRRARTALNAALACERSGCHADAVSRAYYAVLHAARAALQFEAGKETRTHAATANQFGLIIVGRGLVEPEIGSEIGDLQELRMKADYDEEMLFVTADSRSACARATLFLNRIRKLLITAIPPDEL